MNSISDESVMDLEKRKYYIQKYEFTMMGFLIDEDQFEVSPAITRTFQLYETEVPYKKKRQNRKNPPEPATININFPIEFFNTLPYLFSRDLHNHLIVFDPIQILHDRLIVEYFCLIEDETMLHNKREFHFS
jgi:hypothetical protein